MANILKQTLNENGNMKNSPTKVITITLDSPISINDVNSYLPNNGSRYDSKEVQLIPSNSSATILTTDEMIVCVFIAESGVVNPVTNNLEGVWKVISELPFIA